MSEILTVGRLRRSPFYASTLSAGVQGLLPYNGMLIPRGYGNPEAEYWRLIDGVSMWDVAAQRIVQLEGPDAARLAQVLCARDLSQQQVHQGKYAALCDHHGRLINDPIVFKISENCFWLAVANSDIWTWARCVAGERALNVDVSEPDVSPLAVQGPKAEEVVAALFGDWVRTLKYFWLADAELDGIPLKIGRCGWSKQGGFELFLLDGTRGDALWRIVEEAGQPWDIGPGYPNPSERTESGLLNWDVDTDPETNPFEMRMERFVDLHVADDVIGIKALRQIHAKGRTRHQLGIILDGPEVAENQAITWEIQQNGQLIGHMTHQAWSYKLKRMIGYALVGIAAQAGDEVTVMFGGEPRQGHLVELPFTR